ncbi:MAG: signal peptidase I, partial [Myxococcales bacterium]|nr:signal peptidase I [Myxococcales bacterium]
MSRQHLAIVLTVLMPGLGHIALGWVRRGLAVWAAAYCAAGALMLGWAMALFVPVVPVVGAAIAWLALQGVLWRDLLHLPADGPARRDPAPAWVHGVVWLSLGVLPILVGGRLVGTRLVGVARVEGQSMFPVLLDGDEVVFDRRGFAGAPPRPGDLVVVADAQGRQITRVVAVAGQTVALHGTRPVVDGAPLPRRAVSAMRVPRFGGVLAAELARMDGYLERAEGRDYMVCEDPLGPTPAFAEAIRLRPGEIYVLGDNRTATV